MSTDRSVVVSYLLKVGSQALVNNTESMVKKKKLAYHIKLHTIDNSLDDINNRVRESFEEGLKSVELRPIIAHCSLKSLKFC